MRLAVALLFFSISVPASASLTRYDWIGEWSGGNVSGSFVFDDSAPIISQELGGYTVRGGAINKLSLVIGPDTFTRFVSPWDALIAPDGRVTFQDCALDGSPASETDWNQYRWSFRQWDPDKEEMSEIGGRIAAFYVSGFSGDASPTPEPAGFVLVGVGLLGFAALRLSRRSRT